MYTIWEESLKASIQDFDGHAVPVYDTFDSHKIKLDQKDIVYIEYELKPLENTSINSGHELE